MPPSPKPSKAPDAQIRAPTVLFALTAFVGAGLVFWLEPMIGKLLSPRLGGSTAVWNTSLAFFQIALLIGYAYAHGLQALRSLRLQTLVHTGLLIAAAAVLPLSLDRGLGAPWAAHPILWLLAELGLCVGPPFIALSATAPLIQAWFARARGPDRNPYGLYAASNLGSLLALIGYPTLIEPFLTLNRQTFFWTIGYAVYFLLVLSLAGTLWWIGGSPARKPAARTASKLVTLAMWWRRLVWVLLAAAPSSLMLGVTAYLATDIGSTPMMWVAPLALYLLSFIVAFQARPIVPPALVLTLQGFALVVAVTTWGMPIKMLWLQAAVQLLAFFLTAVTCHQGLYNRRPPASRLTEFYLLVSLGGVLGGAFNAFLAPVIFSSVIEYPVVLVAVCLARPWGRGWLAPRDAIPLGVGLFCLILAPIAARAFGPGLAMQLAFGGAMIAAFLLRDRARVFLVLCLGLVISVQAVAAPHQQVLRTDRSFFGVIRIGRHMVPGLGAAKLMAHGTTLHGVQFADPAYRCRPMLYYAPTTPIGQVFRAVEARAAPIRIGAVGMGAGTVATYVRPGDSLRFFEIDPLVVRLATDPANFSYIHGCAQGRVDWVLGDARLTLAREPAGAFDILLVDAFSSDSVPAHLLTVEAMRGYLRLIKPDGVVIMHLSNRNLELTSAVAAVAKAAGGVALRQFYRPPAGTPDLYDSGEDAVIVARDPRALAAFAQDPRWRPAQSNGVRPWTDDYSNLLGALIRGRGHNDVEAKQFAIDEAQPPMSPPPKPPADAAGQGNAPVDAGVD